MRIDLTAEDAQELRELLLDRPHNEGWSDRILDALTRAIEQDNVFDLQVPHD